MMEPDWKQTFPWRTAMVVVAVLLLALLGTVAYLRTVGSGRAVLEEAGRTVRESMRELPAIAEKFRSGTITTTFIDGLANAEASRGGVLELATSRSHEFFRREDSRQVLWGWVDLGTTVSEIRVPVTFRYHLKLSDPWKLTTRGNVCIAVAPSIRPSLPPAIHTDLLEKSSESGWARFNKAENLEELEKQLTPMLQARASDRRHLRAVREECRKASADFVRTWLMREDHWRKDRFTAVVVLFPDELKNPEGTLDVEVDGRPLSPTISLDAGALTGP